MSGKKGMKHYSESFKEQVRQDYGAGTTMRSISRKYGISMYSVKSWCGKRPEVNLRRTAPLKKGRPSSEKSIRYMVIYRHREKYSISEMCLFFEVSRSGYYDYVKRMITRTEILNRQS